MKNAWKILGGCGCLSMIAGAAMLAVFFIGYRGGIPSLRAADLAHYQNTREGRTGNLAESYVDFSFDYPKTWDLKTSDPDNINFVTAERRAEGKTWENLNVGYFRPAGSEAENQALYRQVLTQIEGQFSQQFKDFKKISEGPTRIGAYNGHEALYAGWVEADGKRIDVYTRTVFIPTPDGTKGVSFMMMGTSLNPALEKPEDLGQEGELPTLLNSFKF
ncbi:MAG: hypothetical protein ABI779_04195 [Acidobacteriota bacterium]